MSSNYIFTKYKAQDEIQSRKDRNSWLQITQVNWTTFHA